MKNRYKLLIISGIIIGITSGIIIGIKTSESSLYLESYIADQLNGIPSIPGESIPNFTLQESEHVDFITSKSWRDPSMPFSIDKPSREPSVYSYFEDGTFEIQWSPGLGQPDRVGFYKLFPYSNSHGIIFTITNKNLTQVIPYEIRGEDRLIINFNYVGGLENKYELQGEPSTPFVHLLEEKNIETTFPLWFGITNSTWKIINPNEENNKTLRPSEIEFSNNGKYTLKFSDGCHIKGPFGVIESPHNKLQFVQFDEYCNQPGEGFIIRDIPIILEDEMLTFNDVTYSLNLEK